MMVVTQSVSMCVCNIDSVHLHRLRILSEGIDLSSCQLKRWWFVIQPASSSRSAATQSVRERKIACLFKNRWKGDSAKKVSGRRSRWEMMSTDSTL
ncbi:hypothetical protein CEXT_9391 [Caerostris extrusa]|uniref:Uncharacterized protein n=1 Tax=Caerostris extrusa TaxID=172846 RepID=A0AAV4NMX2_CAEEX|nr:hypothetical protein CEXT_9391 [Caerostris extrusa]